MSKLTECETCGGQVSKSAFACPHCGETKGKNKQKNTKGPGCFSLLFAFGLIIWFASSMSSTKPTASPAKTDTPMQTQSIVTPTKTITKEQKLTQKKAKVKIQLTQTIKDLNKFNTFNNYKKLTIDKLNARVKHMRNMGKTVFFSEDTAKKDKDLKKLWIKAKNLQIKVQRKHYPKMRDALGPLLRKRMWEYNVHVKTIGKGYSRIVLTTAGFANNGFIKQIHNTMGITYSDYRFKRADYKWIKSAREWTYFDLKTKKDNVL